jgi:hypothetical protein
MKMTTYQTEEEILAVVRGFESCETDKAAFKHQDHLTVAVCYLQDLDIADATNKLRTALLRFIDLHGVDRKKYNETITVFWLELVAGVLATVEHNSTLVSKCNLVVESLSNAGLAMEYYSADLLFSDKAREEFVGPDLKDWNVR